VALTIAGDGDFLMNGQELATATQHGARSIIVLLNNGMYGTIRMHQEREYPKRVHGTAAGQPGFRRAGARLWLPRPAHHAHRGVRAGAAGRAGAQQGTLIEVMLDAEVITTRGTLSAITARVLESRHDFLRHFDGGIFSGDVKLAKPDPAIFKLLAERYGMVPADTLFIDDLAANVAAARQLGWQAIHCTAPAGLPAQVAALLPV
jgi:hypothetical protein